MKKTRIIARITAGAAASAVLLTGALVASPAQARSDTGWGGVGVVSTDGSQSIKDTGWGGVY